MYEVYDRIEKRIVGTYKTRAAANRRSDKIDLAYGAYRTSVKFVEKEDIPLDKGSYVGYWNM